jgi:uncharacterized protein (DUF1330 family)
MRDYRRTIRHCKEKHSGRYLSRGDRQECRQEDVIGKDDLGYQLQDWIIVEAYDEAVAFEKYLKNQSGRAFAKKHF